MGRGHNFKTPKKTVRKTRQHKKKTRFNLKFTHCTYMLKNEITKCMNKEHDSGISREMLRTGFILSGCLLFAYVQISI